jgi:hypothetical protein
MSRLAFIGRPWVAFEASDPQHRAWFAEFRKLGTWGKCPVRFIIPDDHGDLITMIQRRLIDYYVGQEFDRSEFIRAKVAPLTSSPFGLPKSEIN